VKTAVPEQRVRRLRPRDLALLLFAVVLLAGLGVLVYLLPQWPTDVDVYRLGAETFIHGNSIYTQFPVSTVGGPLPYTYPPVSVVAFIPLALIPPAVGFALLAGVTTAALFPLLMAYRKGVPELRGILDQPWMVVAAAIALVVSHPVKNTVFWGQINVILMMLVALDCLWPNPKWRRGVLIGIAAAVKLTPAGFALFFLLRKDYKALVTSVISFLVMSLLGLVLMPHDSIIYWTDRIFHATSMNIGLPFANESLTAGLEKIGLSGPALTWTGNLGVVLVVVMTWLGTRRALSDGNNGLALGVNAAGVLLVSPISWSHHWILAMPTSALLLVMGYQRHNGWLLLSGTAGVVIYWLAPQYMMPLFATDWNWDQKIAGSSYQILALALLATMTVRQLAGLTDRGASPPVRNLDFIPAT
jgi:alpha-1,2-mannosyltransferase